MTRKLSDAEPQVAISANLQPVEEHRVAISANQQPVEGSRAAVAANPVPVEVSRSPSSTSKKIAGGSSKAHSMWANELLDDFVMKNVDEASV